MKYYVKFKACFHAIIEALDHKAALNKAKNIAFVGNPERFPEVNGWTSESIEEEKE